MLKGIDISKYQSGNYQKLIDNYGKDFVICRACWRKSVDPYCDRFYQYAKSKGKKLGVYFFPLPSDGTAEDSAKWCADQVKGYIGNTIFALDWENYSGEECRLDESNTEWAYKWLIEFEKLTGNKPLIYMNSNCERSYNWTKVVNNSNGLWLANYGNNDGTDHGKPATRYWKIVALHQFTSKLDKTGLDGDTFYGDTKAWEAYAKAEKKVDDNTGSTSNVDQVRIKQLEEDNARLIKENGNLQTKLKDAKVKVTELDNIL